MEWSDIAPQVETVTRNIARCRRLAIVWALVFPLGAALLVGELQNLVVLPLVGLTGFLVCIGMQWPYSVKCLMCKASLGPGQRESPGKLGVLVQQHRCPVCSHQY